VDRGVPLDGGNMTGVTRYGQYVHRMAGPWTPTVHRLLNHLVDRGLGWVPRPIGFDEHGREVLTFIDGTVPHDPMPAWAWADSVIIDAGTHLAQLHDATAGYLDAEATWQLPAHEPRQVICHNDFAAYNMVFDANHDLAGVIDWDGASPGPRAWDLAYLAYRLVPLCAPGNPDGLEGSIPERRRRLDLLCRCYDRGQTPQQVLATAVWRLDDLADFTARRAANGARHVAAHVQLYHDAAAWLRRSTEELTATSGRSHATIIPLP
jgi:hypothetical protein